MLTRCLSVSVASSLHSMPGATSSHSGSDHRPAGGGTGCFPVSLAIRSARRVCSDVVGRSTSVGQQTNRSTTEIYTLSLHLALAPGEVAATEAHIASCPDCQREMERKSVDLGGRRIH